MFIAKAPKAVGLALALLLAACEASVGSTNNSSQGDNDYFEEPISDGSKKYTPALETSNAFVENFALGKIPEARELFDPRLQAVISEEQLRSAHAQILQNFGPLLEYKSMQWGFGTHSSNPNVLVSVKIVIHGNSETFYVVTFEDDGLYDRITGFKIYPKGTADRVAQAANRALRGT